METFKSDINEHKYADFERKKWPPKKKRIRTTEKNIYVRGRPRHRQSKKAYKPSKNRTPRKGGILENNAGVQKAKHRKKKNMGKQLASLGTRNHDWGGGKNPEER